MTERLEPGRDHALAREQRLLRQLAEHELERERGHRGDGGAVERGAQQLS